MKKYKLILSLLIISLIIGSLFMLSACRRSEIVNENDKLKVAASIFPIYDIVRQVAGEQVEVLLVLPPGASPHTFDISPALLRQLQDSQAFFMVGANLDSWLNDLSQSVPGAKLVDLSEYADLLPVGQSISDKNLDDYQDEYSKDHDEDDHDLGNNKDPLTDDHGHDYDFDPHYWLSPINGRLLALAIAEELSLLDPDNQVYYQERAINFINQLETLDKEWQIQLADLAKREIIVFHDAWNYFANHFKINIVASFEPFPGKSPSPQYLVKLQETIKYHQVTSLFIEPQLSTESLSTIANDLGVEIYLLDPIGGLEDRSDYFSLLDFNVQSLRQAVP